MQNGQSKSSFLYVNEWEMGLWPIFRVHLYSRPEISLFDAMTSLMTEHQNFPEALSWLLQELRF